MGGLQVHHHGALLLEVVGNLAGVLKALGLDQHHLELGGGVDIDHLAPAAVHGAAVIGAGPVVQERGVLLLEIQVVILVFVADGGDHASQIVYQVH